MFVFGKSFFSCLCEIKNWQTSALPEARLKPFDNEQIIRQMFKLSYQIWVLIFENKKKTIIKTLTSFENICKDTVWLEILRGQVFVWKSELEFEKLTKTKKIALFCSFSTP